MPHVARLIVADSDHRVLMPAAVLAGAVVMVGCDIVSKAFGIPVNAVTSLLGIPIVVWIVLKTVNGSSLMSLRGLGIGFGKRKLLCDVDTSFGASSLYGFTRTQRQRQIHFAEGQWPGLAAMMVLSVSPAMISPCCPPPGCETYGLRKHRAHTNRRHELFLTSWRWGGSAYQLIGRLCDADIAAVESALEAVGMSSFAGRRVASMSDGECQRVMIARALAQDTPLILMDEPTSFLDLPNRYELCTLLAELAHSHGKCIVFYT